jgi:alpha-beta hydrolase superfamily lysophospholipase
MESAEFEFQAVDGASLHVRSWNVDEPKAVVQLLHGMAEHSARYARLAGELARAGYTTYAHDHRGHGSSIPEGKPPAIAGVGKLVARIERARVGRRSPSPVIQSLTFGGYNKAFRPVRTEFDWLSRDPDEVDTYVADPLCGFAVSTQTWLDMLSALGRIASPKNVAKVPKDLPLYLFAGDRDPVGFNGAGMVRLRDVYLRAGILDVRLQLYSDGRHEMLNEINRDEVMADFVAWCDEVIAARV